MTTGASQSFLYCARCGEAKERSDFYRHPKNSTGCQTRCKACYRARYIERRPEIIEYTRQHRWEDQRVRMAADARRRDRAAGRASDIEAREIVIPEFCPLTGRPMFHAVRQPLGCSPCVVRLDKSKEYVSGNWVVVSADTQPNMRHRIDKPHRERPAQISPKNP